MVEGFLGLLGAIGAALVAGGLGLLSLLIAKDQKTSEFRQAWIDSLRSDLSGYLACGAQIFSRYAHLYSVYNGTSEFRLRLDQLLESCAALRSDVDKARASLLLRVNPVDDRNFVDALEFHHNLLEVRPPPKEAEIRRAEALLMGVAQKLLKKEWRRVKSGEPLYYVTKWCSLIIALVGFVAFSVLLLTVFFG